MNFRHMLLAAGLLACAGQAKAETFFSDTNIGVRDGWTISNPGEEKGGRDVNKIIVNLGHFDVWDYGTNFFNVDILFSNANEPAYNSAGGSTEFYAVYRAQLSPDKIFGINTAVGPFSAINFEVGGDAEAEDTQFAPDKKLLVAGPNFNIALPEHGFLNIGLHVSKEWNNNGIASCTDSCWLHGGPNFAHGGPVSFDPAPEAEFVWLYHMSFTGLPLDFAGFMNIIGPKGHDGFGAQTKTEILARPRLNLDLGKMLYNHPGKPILFFAVELWENKFGNDHTKVPGSEEVAPEFGIEFHF